MSWTNELYNVYEKNCGNPENDPPLLPIAHKAQKADIEVTIKENGEFVSADVIGKDETETIIPVTEASIAKAGSGAVPNPFADTLLYVAGDFGEYFCSKRSKDEKYFNAYINQLRQWALSEHSHKAVRAVLAYLEKKHITKDLIDSGIFSFDEGAAMLNGKKNISGDNVEKLFVRFKINYDDFLSESRTWLDKSLYDSFIAYDSSLGKEVQLCYATGQMLPVTYKHPYGILKSSAKAKIISANEESGFTYRGRFQSKEQAISVSYDFSQKMHNGLKWLIERQGVSVGGSLMLIVWESALRDLPDITEDADGIIFDDEIEERQYADTFPMYREQLKKSIYGGRFGFSEDNMPEDSKSMVMALDSATTGRLAVCLYSELQTSDFLANIASWHSGTAWFCYNAKQHKYVYRSFSLNKIINCAFGTEQGKFIECGNSGLKSDYVCRLVPCVAEGRKVPKDIIRALISRASSPLKYDNEYNWRDVLGAACAMIRKEKLENKEECEMALDENCRDRSYLYGRLLAVADAAENSTYDKESRRTTNAKRYFEAFSNHPLTTWNIILKQLQPYLAQLDNKLNNSGYKRSYFTNLIDSITDMFKLSDFADNTKLDPIYLHGYSCQLKAIYGGKKDTNNEEE